MARIRVPKIKRSSDVNKNSGIKISHTINKIKDNEMKYMVILTGVFMVLIVCCVYFGMRYDAKGFGSVDYTKAASHLSASGMVVHIGQNDIMSDSEGIKNKPVSVSFSNMTNHSINYVIRFAKEEFMSESCKCDLVDYDKIKFSLDGMTVNTFKNEEMIVTSGMIKSRDEDELNVRFWIDDSQDKNKDCNFYGKFVFEEFNGMELEGSD